MKIAVATHDGNQISAHFGRSPYFAIFEIEEGKSTSRTLRENTFTAHFHGSHDSHQHGEHHPCTEDAHAHQSVAEGLRDCSAVISRGMGRRAWEDLRAHGIEMIVTDETDVATAVQKYLCGELEDRVEKLH